MRIYVCPSFAVLILLIYLLSNCSCQNSSPQRLNTPATSNELIKNLTDTGITLVRTIEVKTKPFVYLIPSNGKIHSQHEQVLTTISGGVVSYSKAQNNSFFAKGALIIAFENRQILQKLEKAKQGVFNTQKEYESQLLGYESLLKSGSANADTIRKKLMISAGLSGSKLEEIDAQNELEKSFLKAPFRGLLADVKVKTGDYAKPGQELMTIYDAENFQIEVKVLESDIGLIHKGSKAVIMPLSYPGVKIPGLLREINPYVNENGLISVTIFVDKLNTGKYDIFPGMNCSVEISAPIGSAISVPKQAVVVRNNKTIVFTCQNNVAKWNFVTIGRESENEYEIKDGLQNGQKIIISNNLQLEHDVIVKEVNSPADTVNTKLSNNEGR